MPDYSDKNDDDVWTPEEIAESLRVSEETVRRWLRKGDLKGLRLGRAWRVYHSDFMNFIEKKTNQG